MNLSKLEELADLISKVDNINKGGCMVAAAMLAPHLSKHFPTKIKVLSYNCRTNISKIANCISSNSVDEWNSHDVVFRHVLLEIKVDSNKVYFDSDGVHHTIDRMQEYLHASLLPGELPIEVAIELAGDENAHSWNTRFNRMNIPVIQDIVNQFFASATI